MSLERLPRIRLAALPTPLEEAPRLTEALGGARILVKRDDLTGLAFGGNKTRKLEYLIADALAGGADVVLTVGAAQSNHCRQTAAAHAGLPDRQALRVRPERPVRPDPSARPERPVQPEQPRWARRSARRATGRT